MTFIRTYERIQIRRHVAADWTSQNEVLLEGEFGLETDTGKFKIGDDSTAWNSLDYFAADRVPIADAGAYFLATDVEAALQEIGANYALKSYVDAGIAGLSWKQSVRAATTAAGTLASDFENGDTIDGVTLSTGDRILIKNQAAPTENGIYTVNASGAPTRSTDANSGAELVNASVFVDQGTTNADTQWTQTTNGPLTLGVSNIVWAQFGAGSISDGDKGDITVSSSGTVWSIDAGVIADTHISASAAIAVSKLAAMTASRTAVTDGSGFLTTSHVTTTELGRLSGVTGNVQTQIDAKQPLDATLTAFGALTIVANSLTIGTGTDAFAQTTFAANTFPARASTGDLVAKTISNDALALLADSDVPRIGTSNTWTGAQTWENSCTLDRVGDATGVSLSLSVDAGELANLKFMAGGFDYFIIRKSASDSALEFCTRNTDGTALHTAISLDRASGVANFKFAPTLTAGQALALGDGGTGAELTDPNADRIMFWDDSAGSVAWLTAGTGLNITTTTISLATANNPVGVHEFPVSAGSMLPSKVGGCAPLTQTASGSNLPDILTLDFDPGTEEYAQFRFTLPKSYDGGTITAKFKWSHAATVTNFGVVWGIQAVAVGDNEAIGTAFGTAQTVTDTGGTTDRSYTSGATGAITIAGTPADGDTIYFRVYRKAADGSDNLAVDARLEEVILTITTDAATDA